MTYVTFDDNSLWRSRIDGTDAVKLTLASHARGALIVVAGRTKDCLHG